MSNGEMVVLLNILDFWWQADQLPFPGVPALAKRMGVSNRSIQRAIESLEQKGLVTRSSTASPMGETRKAFDVSGLVARLVEISRGVEGRRLHNKGNREAHVRKTNGAEDSGKIYRI
ncbi:hypothetical protein CBA19CS11_32120 [Caballeronia novacaledonica]|nr:helix-turn-helix domain-containing protein [Caballeronia novacaledonica]GJH13584.1 hypothetical protein CBA19CS11_32120 [Caballeronia novacaledonica]